MIERAADTLRHFLDRSEEDWTEAVSTDDLDVAIGVMSDLVDTVGYSHKARAPFKQSLLYLQQLRVASRNKEKGWQ